MCWMLRNLLKHYRSCFDLEKFLTSNFHSYHDEIFQSTVWLCELKYKCESAWDMTWGWGLFKFLFVCKMTWIWDLNQEWICCCEIFFQVSNAIKSNIQVCQLNCKSDSRRFMNLEFWVKCTPISKRII